MQPLQNELTQVFDNFLEEYIISKFSLAADAEKTEFGGFAEKTCLRVKHIFPPA